MDKNEGVGLESIAEIIETQDEDGNDTTNWKELAQNLNKAGKQWEGVAKRNYSDLEKIKQDPRLKEELKPDKKEITGFDYGQMAFLKVEGVSEEDHDFILQEVKNTGKELKDVLNFKYVQEELKNRKDERTTKNALPTSKRSSGAAKDEVDYWLQKNEMPSRVDNPELYRKVRKERERLELSHRETPPR